MPARTSKLDDQQTAAIAKALADPNRLEILRKLGEAKDEPTCSWIRDWLALSPATISHHLKELESAGLVQIRREGKFAYIALRRDTLNAYVRRLSSI